MGTPVASVLMDLERFCAASRVVIVAGKGGVGKTTVTAALATAAARTGMSVLIVEVEGKSGLAACFGEAPLTYEEAELRPRCGHGPSPPTTPCWSTSTVTVCDGSPSVSLGRAPSTWSPPPSPACATSSCSAR